MIPVQCAACGNQYELPDEDAGTQAQCACGQVIDIPASEASAEAASTRGTIPVQCPACASRYELAAEDAGTQVQCGCGQVIDVPAARIAIQCGSCGSGYEVGLEDAGTQMQCPCGEIISVPAGEATQTSAIPIRCSACGTDYEVPAADAGSQVQCECGQVLVVPDASPTSPVESASAEPASAEPEPAAQIPFVCPGCGSEYELDADEAGTQVECPCGTLITVPDAPPVEAESREESATSQDDLATKLPPADYESKKKKKESRPFFWPGIVAAATLLLSGAGYVLWPDSDNNGSGQAESGSSGETNSARDSDTIARGPSEWSSWVTDKSIGLVFVRPAQILESEFAQKVPHQDLVQVILAATGADPTNVEQAVFILDPPGGSEDAESPIEPLPTVVIRFSEKADRRTLSSTLLPDGEAVTVNGRTIFQGSSAALFFVDDRNVVFGSPARIKKQLAAASGGASVTNPLLDRAAGKDGLKGDLIVVLNIAKLRDLPLPFPPEVQQSAEGIEEAVVTLDLTGGTLLKIEIGATSEATAEELERQISELTSLATTQFDLLKPTLASELPGDSQAALNIVDDLLGRIRVYRRGSRLTVQTPMPGNLAAAVIEASPLLAQLAGSTGVGSSVAAAASGTTRRKTSGKPATATQSGSAIATGKIKTRPRLPGASQETFRVYDKAMERFLELYRESVELQKKIADAEDPAAAQEAWEGKLAAATAVLRQAERLAVRLADAQPDSREKLLQSRYLLAFMYSQLRMHYEAAILGTFVAQNDDPENDRARECGFIVLAAWQAAYSDSSPDDRRAELDGFVQSAALLDENWPDNENLDKVRYAVGQVLQLNSRHEVAGRWYAKVTENADQYATAQVLAGQSFWRACRELTRQHREMIAVAEAAAAEGQISISAEPVEAPDEGRPESTPPEEPEETEKPETPPEQPDPPADPAPGSEKATGVKDEKAGISFPEVEQKLERLLDRSLKLLKSGIAALQSQPIETPPDLLMAGKMSLCEALLHDGDAAAAVSVLNDEPWPLLAAVAVEEGTERPAQGVQSASFAAATYQLQLRACVAQKQLDAARDAMLALESVAGTKDAARLTAIYLQLGKELTEEIQAADAERGAELRSSFGEFLAVMADRKQQSYGSLLWLAETSTAFGEAAADEAEAKLFHQRAADACQGILDHAATDRDFCSARTVAAIRIRLASSLRLAGRFDRALQILNGLLTLQPNSFKMQFTAAQTLQEWGATAGGEEHLLEAIGGYGDSIWGWGKMSLTLQRHVASGKGKPEYADMMRQARYQIALARRDFALAKGGELKTEHLKRALTEIRTFAQLDATLDGEWWAKIDAIYKAIQGELGETPKSIHDDFKKQPAVEESRTTGL